MQISLIYSIVSIGFRLWLWPKLSFEKKAQINIVGSLAISKAKKEGRNMGHIVAQNEPCGGVEKR